MPAFTILFYYHEDPTSGVAHKSLASIWIATGEREVESPEETNGWFKIVGPIDFGTADKICSSLDTFLSQNGVKIKSVMGAD
jgi:hypothetical protein